MYVLGIDPGKDGGLALIRLHADGDLGWMDCPLVCEMPLTPTGWPDVVEIYRLLTLNIGTSSGHVFSALLTVYLEKVNAMPPRGPAGQRTAGAQSSFNFGKGVGFLLGAFASLQTPVQEVTPQAWKKEILAGTDHSKAEAAAWAFSHYPMLLHRLKRPRGAPHLGKIEALCIATYGARQLLGKKG